MNIVLFRESIARHITLPVVRLLARTAITPDAITWMGFVLSLGAAALIVFDKLVIAGLVFLTGGLFDMLDGALARHTKQTTRFGAIFDSTVDRMIEAAMLLGLLIFYAREASLAGIILVGVTMPSSLLVSYIRARAEGLGLECKVGIFTRAERVILLSAGLLLSQIDYVLFAALGAIAALSLITVGQRLAHVWRMTRADKSPLPS